MMLQGLCGASPSTAELDALLSLARAGTRLLRRRSFYAQIVCEFSAFFDRPDVALNALESADEGLLFDAVWLERCPTLDPLRGDPRFVAVRSRVLERAARVREGLGVSSA
jgi:hypothetical protein